MKHEQFDDLSRESTSNKEELKSKDTSRRNLMLDSNCFREFRMFG